MKYIFTSLIILFVLNGCAKKLDHPKTELNYTITNEVMNLVTSGSGGYGSINSPLMLISDATDIMINSGYVLKINGKTIKGRWSRIKSKGKLVVTYKNLKETVYTRDKNEVHINFDWMLNKLYVSVSPEGELSGHDKLFYKKPQP